MRTRPKTRRKREEIDAKNQLDSMVYSIEKMLREQGDKISGSERGDVENAIADAKKALESNDKAQHGQGARDADPGFAQAGRADVQSGSVAAAPGAGPSAGRRRRTGAGRQRSGQKKDEGVIDAEYVDVEDKK